MSDSYNRHASASVEGVLNVDAHPPRDADYQQVWDGVQECTGLTSSQVKWLLLVQEPHFESTRKMIPSPMLGFCGGHPLGQFHWLIS